MAIVAMADAVAGAVASSTEYNKLIDNIQDLDARLGAVVSGSSAQTRLTALESLTTNTATNGGHGNVQLSTRLGTGVTTASTATAQFTSIAGRATALETLTTDTATNGGHGNVRLSDRFGTGVGTGSNVTTGSATSQLTDLRSRATALEGVTTHVSTGNSALGTRVTALESAGGTSALVEVTRATDQTGLAGSTFTAISWSGVVNSRNTGGTMWTAGNPTRLVVPAGQGGLYEVSAIIVWANTGTTGSLRQVSLRKNGSVTIRVAGALTHNASFFTECSFCQFVELAAGDYLEIMGWHSDGSAQTVKATDGTPNAVLRKVAS
jgi:hypothetical protein